MVVVLVLVGLVLVLVLVVMVAVTVMLVWTVVGWGHIFGRGLGSRTSGKRGGIWGEVGSWKTWGRRGGVAMWAVAVMMGLGLVLLVVVLMVVLLAVLGRGW